MPVEQWFVEKRQKKGIRAAPGTARRRSADAGAGSQSKKRGGGGGAGPGTSTTRRSRRLPRTCHPGCTRWSSKAADREACQSMYSAAGSDPCSRAACPNWPLTTRSCVGDSRVAALAAAIGPGLRRLSLTGAVIKARGTAAVAAAVRKNRIRDLDISYNQIMDTGFLDIARSAQNVRHLNVDGCGISGVGAKAGLWKSSEDDNDEGDSDYDDEEGEESEGQVGGKRKRDFDEGPHHVCLACTTCEAGRPLAAQRRPAGS